jgi:hypothetical protein
MFRLFTRPAGRPRTVRPQVRTPLRLECLEARANPAAPVLTGMKANWGNENYVVVSGVVQDECPALAMIHFGGSTQGKVQVGEDGEFVIALARTGAGRLYLRAEDEEGLISGTKSFGYGDSQVPPAGTQPVLGGVGISRGEDGLWHIRGHVDNTSPIGSIIKVIRGPGDSSGQTGVVDAEGNFDIVLDVGEGGAISISANDQDSGTESDPWDGLVG